MLVFSCHLFIETEEGKGVPTGVDTRLITPYTSYLLREYQWTIRK